MAAMLEQAPNLLRQYAVERQVQGDVLLGEPADLRGLLSSPNLAAGQFAYEKTL